MTVVFAAGNVVFGEEDETEFSTDLRPCETTPRGGKGGGCLLTTIFGSFVVLDEGDDD